MSQQIVSTQWLSGASTIQGLFEYGDILVGSVKWGSNANNYMVWDANQNWELWCEGKKIAEYLSATDRFNFLAGTTIFAFIGSIADLYVDQNITFQAGTSIGYFRGGIAGTRVDLDLTGDDVVVLEDKKQDLKNKTIKASGVEKKYVSVSSTHNITDENVVMVNASGGSINIYLPDSQTLESSSVYDIKIIKTDTSANPVYIYKKSGDAFSSLQNGIGRFVLYSEYSSVTLTLEKLNFVWMTVSRVEGTVTITNSLNMEDGYKMIRINNSSNISINLPLISQFPNVTYSFFKLTTVPNACTIYRAGSDLIDGVGTNINASAQYTKVFITNDGVSQWLTY